MNRFAAIFACLLLANLASGMDKPEGYTGKKRSLEQVTESTAKEGRSEPSEQQLSWLDKYREQLGVDKIRNLLMTEKGMGIEKLYNVARTIRALRLVSKHERDLIDDPEFTKDLIINLAQRYIRGDVVAVVLALHTKSASDWLHEKLADEQSIVNAMAGWQGYLVEQVTDHLIELLRRNHTDAARFLLAVATTSRGVYLLFGHQSEKNDRMTILIAAAQAGDWNIFNKVLRPSLPFINLLDGLENSALLYAISNHHKRIAQALIAAGANPFVNNHQGAPIDSALLRAADANETEVVELLLQNPQVREQVNFTNDEIDSTPLELAARYNNYPMFTMLLAVHGVSVTSDALYAALRTNTQMVKDLLERGVKVNEISEAAEEFPVFAIFDTNDTGVASVDDATARDRLALLLPHNLNVNEQYPDDGDTPLIMAVIQAKSKTVEKLLQAGAKVNPRDTAGHTALYYAQQLETNNKDHIINLLKQYGAQ